MDLHPVVNATVASFMRETLDLDEEQFKLITSALTERLVTALKSVNVAPAAAPKARARRAKAATSPTADGSEGKRSSKPNWYATFGKAVSGRTEALGPLADETEFTFNTDVNIDAEATKKLLDDIRNDPEAMEALAGKTYQTLQECRDAVIAYFKAKQQTVRQMTVTSLVRHCCVTEQILENYKAWFAQNQASVAQEGESEAAAVPAAVPAPAAAAKPVVINRGAAAPVTATVTRKVK